MRIQLAARFRAHRKLVVALAALLGVGVTLSSVFLPETYSTGLGEWRSITLSDSSIARLGPNTEILVLFDEKQRLVQQTGGEAVYTIAPDPNRPFLVECSGSTVRALGTKFGVNCGAKPSVTVAQGAVSVLRGLLPRDQAATVDYVRAEAGYRVWLDPSTPLAPRSVNVHEELAWEHGWIFFQGERAEEAIAEFNRRNKKHIPLPKPSDDDNRHIYGWCDLKDRDKFNKCLDMYPDQWDR